MGEYAECTEYTGQGTDPLVKQKNCAWVRQRWDLIVVDVVGGRGENEGKEVAIPIKWGLSLMR